MADIRIFPYISTPRGIEVCYSVNGGAIRQKHFPPGTSRAAIIADLEGHPLPPVDAGKELAAKKAAEQAHRAASSQPAQTASEDDLKQQEENTAEDLSSRDIAKAHDGIGQLRLPIAIDKGHDDVLETFADPGKQLRDALSESLEEIRELAGDGGEEAQETMEEFLSL